MGVPGFYSWLKKRYPMIKHMINKQSLPQIDYLYLDMNGIIYKCVRDDSIIFKAQLMPRDLEEIWIEIFNYINSIVDLLKPTKTIVLALDGVAPRCKMNNQRTRRFRSAQEYKEFLKQFYGYTDLADSQENFKNNSISPGTRFMQQLNEMIHFFLLKKIEEDNYWKRLSIVFTGSDSPGEGEHKIMEYIRANKHSFHPDDTHCLYGADADLIMLGLTLPVKNACIIRQEYVHASERVQIMSSRKEKEINFQLIYLSILRECFDLEYGELKQTMHIDYNLQSITRDFVFLFFFIGNDFLPRIYAYNIRQKSIEKLIQGFKNYLSLTDSYVAGPELNLPALLLLLTEVGKFQAQFFADKHFEFEKLLNQEKKGFQDELQQLFVSKIKYEEQTLLGLKQMYANLDGTGRLQFYSSYFNIDPNQNPAEFINILAYYVYGLKFVYQYYFQNLASWSWYYPYYFAPLLTDLQYYLTSLLQNGQKLSDFDEGKPFQPFKQLLCILPKESAQLLPTNFQSYILEPTSILRNPIDFYPDTVETVTYGSVRSHESIILIPFLDQSIICHVYDEQISKTSPEDLPCNILRLSRLYEYHHQAEPIQIKSPFGSIASFLSRTNIRDVDLRKEFQWRSRHNIHPISEGDEKLLKMPTLYMRPFKLKQIKGEIGSRFEVQLQQEPAKQYFKLGETVFYGYPLQHSGRIQAILTKNKFIYVDSENFKLGNYRSFLKDTSYEAPLQIRDSPAKLFQYLRTNLSRNMQEKESYYNFLNLSSTQVFLFIVDTRSFTRNLEGDFVRLFKDNFRQSFSIIPATIAEKQKIYQNTLTNINFHNVQEQFEIGQQVLLTHPDPKLCGARGRVVGFHNDHRKVKVQILQEPRYNSSKLGEIVKMLSTKADIFFSLRFSAEILKLQFDQLQTILGSINIITPKDSKLPPSIDIGLNFMSRREHKIVPNLVRVNFRHDFEKKKLNPFKFLELSYRAIEIALEYKELFPEIFIFMERRHNKLVDRARQGTSRIQWDQPIMADAIYQEGTAKSLMKVYKWLVQKEQTHMPASSLYSKQVQHKRIIRLKDQFLSQRAERQKAKKKVKKYVEARTELIDPNFIFSQRLSMLGSLYLKKRPSNHQIGDIVICVSPQFFGHYGAIVGIDDNKYQVLFDEPSFGKNDLGGLCDNLWGYKFEFKQLLNLQTWPQLFVQRIRNASYHQKLGWIDSAQQFYPQYQSKPFQDFEDVRVFTSKVENRKFFSQKFLKTIEVVQQELKQTEVDESFTVVDNRKQQHRYKYSKKVLYIEKEQVEEASKIAQILEAEVVAVDSERTTNELEVFKEVQKEIIENKVGQEEKSNEIGQEEDGTDILG